MAEDILETLQHAVQDVIAPDVRELKVRMAALEKQSENQYNSLRDQYGSLREQFTSLREQQDANFKALMAAIGESKAKSDLDTYKLISALTERIAVLEAARH